MGIKSTTMYQVTIQLKRELQKEDGDFPFDFEGQPRLIPTSVFRFNTQSLANLPTILDFSQLEAIETKYLAP